ncbi:MAG: hypothetical protein AAF559_12205 [Pseudomonadota bacterium]
MQNAHQGLFVGGELTAATAFAYEMSTQMTFNEFKQASAGGGRLIFVASLHRLGVHGRKRVSLLFPAHDPKAKEAHEHRVFKGLHSNMLHKGPPGPNDDSAFPFLLLHIIRNKGKLLSRIMGKKTCH